VVLFNTSAGEYRFLCNGVVIASGIGAMLKKGCDFTIQHNSSDRRVLIKSGFGSGKGSASIQSPPGNIRCTITDRNILDDSCHCGGCSEIGRCGVGMRVWACWKRLSERANR